MKTKNLNLVMLFAVCLAAQGCATGYNRVSSSNVSNIGFDLETAPQKLETAVSSYEGIMVPTFEGGQTVPVISGISTHGQRLNKFFGGRSSTIATGDAAYTLGYLYADCNKDVTPIADIPSVELTQKPKLVPGPGEVRPAIYSTSAMLGVKMGFSKEAAGAPSSVKVGFNRQEEASTPILIQPSEKRSDRYVAGTTSFIANMEHAVDLKEGAYEGEPHKFYQYVAFGPSANHLSLRSDVRRNLLKKMTPFMQDSFCQDDYETKMR